MRKKVLIWLIVVLAFSPTYVFADDSNDLDDYKDNISAIGEQLKLIVEGLEATMPYTDPVLGPKPETNLIKTALELEKTIKALNASNEFVPLFQMKSNLLHFCSFDLLQM